MQQHDIDGMDGIHYTKRDAPPCIDVMQGDKQPSGHHLAAAYGEEAHS